MTVIVRDRGKRGLLMWFKYNQPQLYSRMKSRLPNDGGLAAFGLVDPAATATPAPVSRTFSDLFKDIASTVSQAYLTKQQIDGQRKIVDLQLKQAAAGLPPLQIDPAQYGLTPQVAVGVNADTKRTVFMIAGGLGLLYLLSQAMNARRR